MNCIWIKSFTYCVRVFVKTTMIYRLFYYLQSIMIFAIARSQPLTYNRVYMYPSWAQAFGWLLALSSMIIVPAYAAYRISRETGTIKEV